MFLSPKMHLSFMAISKVIFGNGENVRKILGGGVQFSVDCTN